MNILTISNNHNSDIDVIFLEFDATNIYNKIVKCSAVKLKKVAIEYNT